MRVATTLALTASLLSTTQGLAVQKQATSPRVVRMDTQRIPVRNPAARDRLRRRGTVSVDLDNEETLYFINGTLGTPPQNLMLHIDTGSSDLWVNTPSSLLCSMSGDPCSVAGTYTANLSSTYSYVGSWFNISYVDGSGAGGDYATDTFTVGGDTLESLQFGIGYTSSSLQGILGIGYAANEVQVGRAGKPAYSNLPAQMVSGGLIQSNAYSLWLNDLNANTGSILFGGVDTEQFSGPLSTLPIEPILGSYTEFFITLTCISLGGTVIQNIMELAVLLDSGSSLTYLPNDVAQTIYGEVGATYVAQQNLAYVPCSMANSTTTMDFEFTEPVISVPLSELVLDITTGSGQGMTYPEGQPACLFGIAPAGEGTSVLGDTFLRSAYVVFDLANNQISLAQTKFNATASNVQEIGTGTSAVPGATVVPNAASPTTGGGSAMGFESAALRLSSSSALGTLSAVFASAVAGFLLVAI